jgi:glycyl-tRNA synthetase
VTVDVQTLADQQVTIRDRDTTAQERITLDQVRTYIQDKLVVD